MFDILRTALSSNNFIAKTWNMILRNRFVGVHPEHTYSVREAARYLGVHRCTIYAYINLPRKPLPYKRTLDGSHMVFLGADLIAFKSAGLPKKGRKRETYKK